MSFRAGHINDRPTAQVEGVRLGAVTDMLDLGAVEDGDPTQLVQSCEQSRCEVQILRHVRDCVI